MHNKQVLSAQTQARRQLLMLVAFMFIGYFTGSMLSVVVAFLYTGADLQATQELIAGATSNPAYRNVSIVLQAVFALTAFWATPLFFRYTIERERIAPQFAWKPNTVLAMVLTLLLTVVFMLANSVFIVWNQSLELPAFLSGLEEQLRALEKAAEEATNMMLQFQSLGDFLFVLLVIAVLPAFAEEYLFRGTMQRIIFQGWGNAHAAIWISAAVFSLIHMQWYGFVPRMFLGVLFGYLYYWSGNNLWPPILAHFFNNGYTLLVAYLAQQGIIDMPEDGQAAPSSWLVVVFAGAGAVALGFLFRAYYQKRQHLVQSHEVE